MTTQRRFPVLNIYRRPNEQNWMIGSVPWDFAETFRVQAEANHTQSLERLAERGGLAPVEIYAAAHRMTVRDVFNGAIDKSKAEEWLVAETTKYE